MKRLVFVVVVALALSASLSAQQAPITSFLGFDRAVQPSFLNAAAADTDLVPPLALPSFAPSWQPVPSAALPAVPAPPPPVRGDLEMRWDVAAGYEYVHFNSAPFNANLSGFQAGVAYSLNDWFALEGKFIGAWGGTVFSPGGTTKIEEITGGARILWNRAPRRFSPWTHVLVGLAHVNPQIAHQSKNGLAVQAGGGVDYYFNPRLSFRGEADYLLTRLYSATQSNVQIGVGFVIHF